MAKKDVNRLKIMLAVTKHSNKWLAEMLGKDQATISKWCTNTCQSEIQESKHKIRSHGFIISFSVCMFHIHARQCLLRGILLSACEMGEQAL